MRLGTLPASLEAGELEMTAATASVHVNQAQPRLSLVQPRLDLEALAAEWQVALDAADSAIAASTPLLKSREVAARRERLQFERRAVAAELRRFGGVTSAEVEPGAPGGVAAVRTPGSVTTTAKRTPRI
jgi:hypothetical protein